MMSSQIVGCGKQQAGTKNAFDSTFAIVEAMVAPPQLPVTAPLLDLFAVTMAAEATATPAAAALSQNNVPPAFHLQQKAPPMYAYAATFVNLQATAVPPLTRLPLLHILTGSLCLLTWKQHSPPKQTPSTSSSTFHLSSSALRLQPSK
jgi:hypothetical protein